MTFKNISENAVLNAAGRLLDPGVKVFMNVEYYAKHKDFIDAYVARKVGEITGIKEYEDFMNGVKTTPAKEKKIDLMEEVRAEEEAKSKEAEAKPEPKAAPVSKEKEAEATKEDEVVEAEATKEEAPEETAPKKKPTPRRRRASTKKTEDA